MILYPHLIFLLLKLEYSERTRSIPWLLMPWHLTSPGHKQKQYWICGICRMNLCLVSTRKDFDYLHHLSVEKLLKIQICFYVFLNKPSMARVNRKSVEFSVFWCYLQLYQRCKDDPPIPRDMPPVAGKIAWARQLYRRIQEPMDIFAVSINT